MKTVFDITAGNTLRSAIVGCMSVCLLAALEGHASKVRDETHTYTMQAGDTLIAVSERMLVSPLAWREVAQLNNIQRPRHIPVGTSVQIPVRLIRTTPTAATVIAVTGEATLTSRTQGQREVQSGQKFDISDEIQTGSGGHVTIQLADGSEIRIRPETTVRLIRSDHYQPAGFFKSRLQLIKGRVDSLVKKTPGLPPSLEIQTPQATMGVRGTEFRSVAGLAGLDASGAEVISGKVAANSTTYVDAGHGVRVDQGKPPQVSRLLAAPQPLPESQQKQERLIVRLPVHPLPDATAYRLRIAQDAQFRNIAADMVQATPEFRLSGLPDGQYHVSARGIDAHGLEGLDATWPLQVKAHPEPPMTLSPPQGGKTRSAQVELAWATVAQATAYHLQVIPAQGQWDTPLVNRTALNANQATIALPAGDYLWRLASTGSDGDQGPWGDPAMFQLRAVPEPIGAPTVTAGALTYAWRGEPGQTYEFQVSQETTFATLIEHVRLSSPGFSMSKPLRGGTLYARYRAIDPDGYVGPFIQPQRVDLPSCMLDTAGRCVRQGSGAVMLQH